MRTGWAYRWYKLKCWIKHYVSFGYHLFFNPVVRKQRQNPKDIPIIIISFNQLYYLEQLITFLLGHDYKNIVILDNRSTYPPLLDYLDQIEQHVTVHRLDDNLGHLAFWKHDPTFKRYCKGYYVVTDPDIVPVADCPVDFMQTFIHLLDQAYDRTKVGFSLKTDDIPDSNPNKTAILNWESKYSRVRIHPKAHKAEIDTTFALYKPGYHYRLRHFTKAWRTNHPIQARHGGWYLDPKMLTKEQAYYMKTANDSASWQINEQGELINKKHKPIYNNE